LDGIIAMANTLLLKKLGKHIKKLRMEKGLSQTELANIIDKDQQSIQRLEAGKINPSFLYLYEVSKGLDVPFKTLTEFSFGSK
jgi:putative transcriptional regulator